MTLLRNIYRKARHLALLALVLALLASACTGVNINLSGGPPNNALTLVWTYPTSIADWAEVAIADFNSQGLKAEDGRPIWVEGSATDAGQAVADMVNGATLPTLWTTAQPYWRDVLQEAVGSDVFLPNCLSVAESPLVIGMWEPVARALGWPSRTIGWLDVASLAADPSGWNYYSGGEFGDTLRISHAHPGLSDSGVETLQALVYAAESAPDMIAASDIQNPIVQASVGAFESAVAWFSIDTNQLQETMLSRGISYLNAGIMYESDVVTQGERSPKLVAIYPFEGTFMATFPSCVRAGMDENTTRAVEALLAYLLDAPAQGQALQHGLRPVNEAVPVDAPVDELHGADPTQPAIIFNPPGADTVLAIQELWQSQRKDVNLAMVLDVSGSMEGQKIQQVRLSAVEFVKQMGDDDRLTVIIFADYPSVLVSNTAVGTSRAEIVNMINSIGAGGGTALYDSIAFAAEDLAKHRSSDAANAMVVLTDGQNTVANRFDQPDERFGLAVELAGGSVYTIAYGEDADQNVMRDIALATDGIAYQGDVSTIGDIYAEISAAFGGSAGIGR